MPLYLVTLPDYFFGVIFMLDVFQFNLYCIKQPPASKRRYIMHKGKSQFHQYLTISGSYATRFKRGGNIITISEEEIPPVKTAYNGRKELIRITRELRGALDNFSSAVDKPDMPASWAIKSRELNESFLVIQTLVLQMQLASAHFRLQEEAKEKKKRVQPPRSQLFVEVDYQIQLGAKRLRQLLSRSFLLSTIATQPSKKSSRGGHLKYRLRLIEATLSQRQAEADGAFALYKKESDVWEEDITNRIALLSLL